MGTSAPSNGPGSGVPFDPPWLDAIILPQIGNGIPSDDDGDRDDNNRDDHRLDQVAQDPSESPEIAPERRFYRARLKLGDFARTGDQGSFRKAIGHYSRTGMGGAHRAAKRMRTSTKSAANLFRVLQSAREGTDTAISEWVTLLTGRNASAREIIDEIIRRVAPSGGSPDETSIQDSMAQAMQDLLEENPDINFLHLDDGNIWTLIEGFLGYEAFNRLCLDIGQVYESPALSPLERVTRMNDMHDYLKAEISVQIEKLRRTNPNAASDQLKTVLQTAVENTFIVYEGSL